MACESVCEMPTNLMQPRKKAPRQIRGPNYRRYKEFSMNNSSCSTTAAPENLGHISKSQVFGLPNQKGFAKLYVLPSHAQSSGSGGFPMQLPHRHNDDGNSTITGWNTMPGSQTNVKIDIHCGNQANPMHVNPTSASSHMANPNNGGAYVGQQFSTRMRPCCERFNDSNLPYVGPNFNHEPANTSDRESMEDYDIADVPTTRARPGKVNHFDELMQTAMRGCELAEDMAITHQNRPCFKKIDSLCARMKQDLMRPDSVLANINSQGIVWAVKDMIFVFTRIINAWNIIKGYVYNTPEGLNNVKSSLSSEFYASFAKWEVATLDFCNNLIESFENINAMVQSQRVALQKLSANTTGGKGGRHRSGNVATSIPTAPNDHERSAKNALEEAMQLFSAHSLHEMADTSAKAKNCNTEERRSQSPSPMTSYFLNVVKNSEETQRQAVAKGTYMKTGLYNPLKKEVYGEMIGLATAVAPSLLCVAKPVSCESKSIFTQSSVPSFYAPFTRSVDCCGAFNHHCCTAMMREHGDATVAAAAEPDGSSLSSLIEFGVPKEMEKRTQAPLERPVGITTADPKVEYLLHRICNLNEAEYFFSSQFTKNYFPDFQPCVPNYSDLRTIILKVQAGGYFTLADIVYDLRQIVFCAKCYLQMHPNALLCSSTAAFEKELELILLNV